MNDAHVHTLSPLSIVHLFLSLMILCRAQPWRQRPCACFDILSLQVPQWDLHWLNTQPYRWRTCSTIAGNKHLRQQFLLNHIFSIMMSQHEMTSAIKQNGKGKVAMQDSFSSKYAPLELSVNLFSGMFWHCATCWSMLARHLQSLFQPSHTG